MAHTAHIAHIAHMAHTVMRGDAGSVLLVSALLGVIAGLQLAGDHYENPVKVEEWNCEDGCSVVLDAYGRLIYNDGSGLHYLLKETESTVYTKHTIQECPSNLIAIGRVGAEIWATSSNFILCYSTLAGKHRIVNENANEKPNLEFQLHVGTISAMMEDDDQEWVYLDMYGDVWRSVYIAPTGPADQIKQEIHKLQIKDIHHVKQLAVADNIIFYEDILGQLYRYVGGIHARPHTLRLLLPAGCGAIQRLDGVFGSLFVFCDNCTLEVRVNHLPAPAPLARQLPGIEIPELQLGENLKHTDLLGYTALDCNNFGCVTLKKKELYWLNRKTTSDGEEPPAKNTTTAAAATTTTPLMETTPTVPTETPSTPLTGTTPTVPTGTPLAGSSSMASAATDQVWPTGGSTPEPAATRLSIVGRYRTSRKTSLDSKLLPLAVTSTVVFLLGMFSLARAVARPPVARLVEGVCREAPGLATAPEPGKAPRRPGPRKVLAALKSLKPCKRPKPCNPLQPPRLPKLPKPSKVCKLPQATSAPKRPPAPSAHKTCLVGTRCWGCGCETEYC